MQAKASISSRGGITIPVAMRRALGLKPRDVILIEVTEQGLLVRSAGNVPIEIYSEKRVSSFTRDESAIGKRLTLAREELERKLADGLNSGSATEMTKKNWRDLRQGLRKRPTRRKG